MSNIYLFKPKRMTIEQYKERIEALMKAYDDIIDFYDVLKPEDKAKVDVMEKEIDHALINLDAIGYAIV